VEKSVVGASGRISTPSGGRSMSSVAPDMSGDGSAVEGEGMRSVEADE
jgi:hypothetical protein